MTAPITAFRDAHRFLSNFWPAPVWLDGMQYPTVEHAYQAAKTTSFRERAGIAELRTPGDAKRAGRRVTMRPDWDAVKLAIMADLTRQKFTREPLRSMLLATGDAELVEGNTWGDTFWGVCRGQGCNHLGRILMSVRDALRVA